MKISVALCTFNGDRYLKEQLDSILMQIKNDDELIISDDGSTDNTIEIIKTYMDRFSSIKLVAGPKKGFVKNFENAIAHCTGDIIFLSDQDDIWVKEKVNRIIDIFQNNQKVQVVMHNMNFFCGDEIVNQNVIPYHSGVLRNLIKSCYWGCCMAFTKEFQEKDLYFPKDLISHDQWIGLLSEKKKSTYFLDEALINHRIHERNKTKKNPYLKRIQFRMNLLERIIMSYVKKN